MRSVGIDCQIGRSEFSEISSFCQRRELSLAGSRFQYFFGDPSSARTFVTLIARELQQSRSSVVEMIITDALLLREASADSFGTIEFDLKGGNGGLRNIDAIASLCRILELAEPQGVNFILTAEERESFERMRNFFLSLKHALYLTNRPGSAQRLRVEQLAGIWAEYAAATMAVTGKVSPLCRVKGKADLDALEAIASIAHLLAHRIYNSDTLRRKFCGEFMRQGSYLAATRHTLPSLVLVPAKWLNKEAATKRRRVLMR